MGKVTTLSQRHTHKSLTRRDQRSVDRKVSGATREGLHVDSPFFWVQLVSLKGTLLSQQLDLINELIATVVAGTRVTLRVLVSQAGALQLEGVSICKVLGCDQFDATELSFLLFQEKVGHLGIELFQRLIVWKGQRSAIGTNGGGEGSLNWVNHTFSTVAKKGVRQFAEEIFHFLALLFMFLFVCV